MKFRIARLKWCLAVVSVVAGFAATAAVDPARYLDDVKYLASQKLRGRGTGTPQLEEAGRHIAQQFRSFGLRPVDGDGYLQAFTVTTNARLGPANRFAYTANGHKTELAFREDFIPFNFSSKARLEGPLVFAGYGITAPEYHYDDYAGLDVKDKIVLILRHEPQEFDEHSVFAGKIFTQHAQFSSKATNAKNHGARGVILVTDRANHPNDADTLENFAETVGPADAGIPFVQVRASVADAWFELAGKKAADLEAAIDKELKPQSFAFPETLTVDANLDLERAVETVHNVTAYLPGQTDEYIIIGAHYDHLGLGEQFSMAPSLAGTVHPGADDNASGTAGVIELARWFSKQPKPRRGILFLAFSGEELGLLGSSYYVNHPELPLEKAVAMINMDMIGRIREDRVFIGGAGTGTTLKATIERVAARHHLKLDYSEVGGYGSSDHTSFITKQVPVLFFFSGLHSDYHKPSDTWDKIDAPDAARLLGLVSDVAADLMDTPARPEFVKVAPPVGALAGAGGYGPYFGSVPDFADNGNKGVRFADITPGSPAAQAGFRAGDLLVEFGGKAVGNLYDFTYALRAHQPGDVVVVKVMRGGQAVVANVTLAKRN